MLDKLLWSVVTLARGSYICHWILLLLVGALVAVIVFRCEAVEHEICRDQHANSRSVNPDVAKIISHEPRADFHIHLI